MSEDDIKLPEHAALLILERLCRDSVEGKSEFPPQLVRELQIHYLVLLERLRAALPKESKAQEVAGIAETLVDLGWEPAKARNEVAKRSGVRRDTVAREHRRRHKADKNRPK